MKKLNQITILKRNLVEAVASNTKLARELEYESKRAYELNEERGELVIRIDELKRKIWSLERGPQDFVMKEETRLNQVERENQWLRETLRLMIVPVDKLPKENKNE